MLDFLLFLLLTAFVLILTAAFNVLRDLLRERGNGYIPYDKYVRRYHRSLRPPYNYDDDDDDDGTTPQKK